MGLVYFALDIANCYLGWSILDRGGMP